MCKGMRGNGWGRYEPFYPCYVCPNHFEFSLLKFIVLVYSLVKLDHWNLKVFQSFWEALYRKGSEHLGPLTRYPSQALRTVVVSDLSLCYLKSSSTYVLSVAFILSSFFFSPIKITVKLFILVLQNNCQLFHQRISSWYQWFMIFTCFFVCLFIFFKTISTWNLITEVYGKLQRSNLMEYYLFLWLIYWVVYKLTKTAFYIQLNLRLLSSYDLPLSKTHILKEKLEVLQESCCANWA